MRVKSTPSRSNASSCSVSSMESVSGLGHLYFPRSRRLYQIASPVRSQTIAFTRSARFPREEEQIATNGARTERLGDDGAQAAEAAPHVHGRHRHENPRIGRQLQHRSLESSRTTAGSAPAAISSDKQMPLPCMRRRATPAEALAVSGIADARGCAAGATTTGTMRGTCATAVACSLPFQRVKY